MLFVQEGQEIVGNYRDGEFKVEIKDYYSGQAGYSSDLIVQGKVAGDNIEGRWTFDTYSGTFTARRSGS